MRVPLICVFVALGLLGCESTDSDNITTAGMFANLSARADGTGSTRATARLKVGGAASNTFVELVDSDTLKAEVLGVSKTMAHHDDLFGQVWYDASFEGDSDGTRVTISLIRDDDPASDQSAMDSVATLPAPFSLIAPTQDDSFSRSLSEFVVVWDDDGGDDPMRLSIDGDCVSYTISDEDVNDTGSFTVTAGALVPSDDTGETCVATVTLERYREGSVDSNYGEGGVFLATQTRSVSFTSTP